MTSGGQRDVNTGAGPCPGPRPPPTLTLAFHDVDGQPLERWALDTRPAKCLGRFFSQAPGLGARPLHTEHARVRRLAELAVATGVLAR